MSWAFAACLGALGATLHDAFELTEVLRARRNDLPDEWKTAAFVLATMLRIASGAALAGLLATIGGLGVISAVLLGMLAPMGVRRMAESADIGRGRG